MSPPTTRGTAASDAYRAARDRLLEQREDLAAARDGWSPPELDTFNFATDWFDVLAAEQPEAVALHLVTRTDADAAGPEALVDTTVSYAGLSTRSQQVAGWLWEQGVRPGDRLLLVLGNVVPLWELMLAGIRLGAVLVPATTLVSRDGLADRVARGEPRVVVAAAADAERFGEVASGCLRVVVDGEASGWEPYDGAEGHATLDEVLAHTGDEAPRTRPDDPLLLYFTSGTTAQPKLVQHTHASYPVGHLSTMYWIGLRPGDVHLNVSSSGWAKHAWSCFFAPFAAGATALVLALPRFDGRVLLEVLTSREVTTFCAPPTVWRMLVQEDLAAWHPPVRELVAAGEPLNPEVIEHVRKVWGKTVRDGYGQTETTAQVGNAPGQEVKVGSMGLPLPGYTIELVDPVSGEVGDDGEVCVALSPRPVGVMTGYAGDDELTAEAMADGRYHTGDVASRDADGYLTYVGRSDDVFKASDYRISPFELESVLVEHPAVAEAAVVPSPDPVRAAVPKAFVTLAAGQEPSRETAVSVLLHCRERLAPYQRIRLLEFVGGDGLPKTISGKIRRVELRTAEADRVARSIGGGSGEFAEADLPELRGD